MTAKEFLRRARSADRWIDEATERAKRLRARLESGRQSGVTGMPRGGAADWTQTADKLIELEKRINERIREMVCLKQAAMDAIDRIEDSRQREVLELYYIDGLTWERVAERMGFEVRQIYRLHGQALLKVTVPKDVIECQY